MEHNTRPLPLMAHLVLGYPTLKDSIDTAIQYIGAGIQILELQIPFSHPTADGPVITVACQEAIKNGTTVQDCLDAIRALKQAYPDQEIVPMSYINRAFSYGLRDFCNHLREIGINHVIIPDLPVDATVSGEITQSGLKLVPVLAANTKVERLNTLKTMGFDLFYLMSDFKITGSEFSLNPRLKAVIEAIRSFPGQPRIGIGFGISTAAQMQVVTQSADFAIVGSSLIQAKQNDKLDTYLATIRSAFSAS